MNPKRLLVLAAAVYQLPFIERAIQLGCTVYTVDNVPSNPGHQLAHESFGLDTTDIPSILNLAKDLKIDGVLAACTDVAVETAAVVAEELQLSGVHPSRKAAETLCQKMNFRRYLDRYPSLNVPYFFDRNIDPDWSINGSWLAKPDRASGSKGIFVFNDMKSLVAGADGTAAESLNGRYLVEQFVDGDNHTAEGWLEDGEVRALFVLDRQTPPPDFAVQTIGHRTPSQLSPVKRDELTAALSGILSDLGYLNGPFDCDFICTPSGRLVLLEIAPRVGGNSICRLLQSAYGFDLVDCAVRGCVGLPYTIQPREASQFYSLRIFHATGEADDQVVRTSGLLASHPWLSMLTLDRTVSAGTSASRPVRVGEALIVADDYASLTDRETELGANFPATWWT